MFSRRRFIKLGAASVGSLALPKFGLLPALAQAKASTDYKALVCVFLFGGNDSNNTIIPIDLPNSTYSQYQTLRASLALSEAQLTQPIPDKNGINWAFHAALPDLATFFKNGKLAVAANVGPLVQPVNRGQVSNPTLIPTHLFSHSDQQLEWQTSDPLELTPFGWGGRAADQVLANSMNGNPTFPAFFSVAGNALLGNGQNTQQVALNPGATLNMTGFDYNVPPTNPRSVALTDLLTTETGLSLVQVGNGIVSNSISDARQLAAALKGTSVADYNFGPSGKTSLALQLQQVAQIIKAREGLNMQRQIFFCSLGGFDTHTIELETHNKLYPILNDALASFYNYVASNITGISSENVTLFTESDFSRTFQPTTGDGSDHAWGSHHLILGGAVKGQSVYFNTFPPFALGQGDDFDTRGRWIPSSAVDQYGETLVKWFGLNSSAVFPNLVNPDGSLRFGPNMLQFL